MFSMMFVQASERRSSAGKPSLLTVRISSNPSRMLFETLLQILSLTLFEKLPLKQAVAGLEPTTNNPAFHSQLNLFEF
jgi:hypothetical protein